MVALELGQHPLGVRPLAECVRKLAVDEVDHRDVEEELAEVLGLLGEHLAQQVVRDRRVVPGELGHEPRRVGVTAQCQRGEPEAGRPAFGAIPQLLDDLGRRVDARRV